MTVWVWKSWGGAKRSIEADMVKFESDHVCFYRRGPGGPALVLAVKNSDIGDLHPVEEGDPKWW